MDDLISRQALCRYALNQKDKSVTPNDIMRFPSADRPTGEWVLSEDQRHEDTDNGNYLYVCSNCFHSDIHAKSQIVPYCWWCGANMKGGAE